MTAASAASCQISASPTIRSAATVACDSPLTTFAPTITWFPGEPVCPDAAGEEEDDERDLARRQDQAEVGLRPCQVEDGESEGDRRDRVAEERDRPAGEEKSKLALA